MLESSLGHTGNLRFRKEKSLAPWQAVFASHSCLTTQLCVQCQHPGGSKQALVKPFTPRKVATVTFQGSFFL